MRYRPSPRRSTPEALHVHGSPGDPERTAQDSQTAESRCTCTGGPYHHGPEGLRQVLQEITARPPHEQPAEEDADDD